MVGNVGKLSTPTTTSSNDFRQQEYAGPKISYFQRYLVECFINVVHGGEGASWLKVGAN